MLPVVLLLSVARADIPPPPDYVETCYVEQRCGDVGGVECRASFSGREECEALEARGLMQACRRGGASVWTEVFCNQELPEPGPAPTPTDGPPPADPAPADPVPQPETSRCDSGAAGGVGWLALGLIAAASRRRR